VEIARRNVSISGIYVKLLRLEIGSRVLAHLSVLTVTDLAVRLSASMFHRIPRHGGRTLPRLTEAALERVPEIKVHKITLRGHRKSKLGIPEEKKYSVNCEDGTLTVFFFLSSCHKHQKPQAPVRNRQTRKVAIAKVRIGYVRSS